MTNLLENSFLQRVKNLDNLEIEKLSNNLVDKLNRVHKEKDKTINWKEDYIVDSNLSLYNHGLTRNHGLKDYILIDYINNNYYLLKDRMASRLIDDSSILKTNIKEDLTISLNPSEKFGDRLVDYLDLNIIAYYNRKIASNIIKKLEKNDNSVKFYKLFSYYSAKYLIDLINHKNTLKSKEEKEPMQELIDFIFDSFEDFTINKPLWAQKKEA